MEAVYAQQRRTAAEMTGYSTKLTFIKSRKCGSASDAIRNRLPERLSTTTCEKSILSFTRKPLSEAFAEICEIASGKMKSRTMCPLCLREYRNERNVTKVCASMNYGENDCFFRHFSIVQNSAIRGLSVF